MKNYNTPINYKIGKTLMVQEDWQSSVNNLCSMYSTIINVSFSKIGSVNCQMSL